MNEATLIALSIVVFGWAILADWFAARNLTGPLVFMVAGLVLANSSWGIGSVDIEGSTVDALANTIAVTIVFSVIAHGIAARPLTTLNVRQSTTLNVGRPTRPTPTGQVELPGCTPTVGSMYLLSPHGHHDDSTGVGDRAAPG